MTIEGERSSELFTAWKDGDIGIDIGISCGIAAWMWFPVSSDCELSNAASGRLDPMLEEWGARIVSIKCDATCDKPAKAMSCPRVSSREVASAASSTMTAPTIPMPNGDM